MSGEKIRIQIKSTSEEMIERLDLDEIFWEETGLHKNLEGWNEGRERRN